MRIDRVVMAFALSAPLVSILPAQAQNTPGNTLGGPAIAGVCMLSREAMFGNAKVGLAATARLKVLAEQARAQIEAERKPIDADVQAYRAQASSLSAEQRQAREKTLGERMQQVQAEQASKARQLEATRAKALNQIASDAQPVIASVYQSRHCGLLLDRNAVLGGNLSNDLTAAVVQQLDAKLTTISFNLEPAPAAATNANGAP